MKDLLDITKVKGTVVFEFSEEGVLIESSDLSMDSKQFIPKSLGRTVAALHLERAVQAMKENEDKWLIENIFEVMIELEEFKKDNE